MGSRNIRQHFAAARYLLLVVISATVFTSCSGTKGHHSVWREEYIHTVSTSPQLMDYVRRENIPLHTVTAEELVARLITGVEKKWYAPDNMDVCWLIALMGDKAVRPLAGCIDSNVDNEHLLKFVSCALAETRSEKAMPVLVRIMTETEQNGRLRFEKVAWLAALTSSNLAITLDAEGPLDAYRQLLRTPMSGESAYVGLAKVHAARALAAWKPEEGVQALLELVNHREEMAMEPSWTWYRAGLALSFLTRIDDHPVQDEGQAPMAAFWKDWWKENRAAFIEDDGKSIQDLLRKEVAEARSDIFTPLESESPSSE